MSNTGPQKRDVEQAVEEENATLRATRSAGTFTISPELFEKVRDLLSTYWSTIDGHQLYLSPKLNNNGDLRKRFANPTPLGFLGYVMLLGEKPDIHLT